MIDLQVQREFIISLIIILVLGLIKWVLNRVIHNRVDDVAIRYKWRKFTTYISVIIGAGLIMPLWFDRLRSMATFFGLFTAGLAIALRDPLANFVGWLFILWRRPFTIGDRIEIKGEMSGDVIDIRIFQFSLIEIGNWVDADQSTGRVVHIPNSLVLTGQIANYMAGFSFIWNEIPVMITFESNWNKAKELLTGIVNRQVGEFDEATRKKIRNTSRKFLIYYGTLTPIVYTRVKESGVLLTIRYLCQPQQRRTSESMIWEEILTVFNAEADIQFAYPTRRFYFQGEKKGETGLDSFE